MIIEEKYQIEPVMLKAGYKKGKDEASNNISSITFTKDDIEFTFVYEKLYIIWSKKQITPKGKTNLVLGVIPYDSKKTEYQNYI